MSRFPKTIRGHHEEGVTLVELMISMLLFSILAAGTFVAMSSQQDSAHRQGRSTGLVDTGRSALDLLAMQVAAIKSGMPTGLAVLNMPLSLTYPSGLPALPTCTDGADSAVPSLQLIHSPIPDPVITDLSPDVLRILRPDGGVWGSLSASAAPTDTMVQIRTTDSANGVTPLIPPPFRRNDWALMTRYDRAVIFQLTNKVATGCAPGPFCLPKSMGTYGDPSPLGPGFPVFRARWQRYSVNPTGFAGRTLDVAGIGSGAAAEPAVVGVEDFQVALGVDTNNNGIIDAENRSSAGVDEWIGNVAGEALADPCDLSRLRAVRITLVLRANSADEGTQLAVPAIEDRPARAADGVYRVILSTTVAVRQ